MTSILSLADEVLDQIIEKLELYDQKSLRSTCSQINAVSEPHVFSTIVISDQDLLRLVQLLKTLGARDNSPIAKHVRMLKIAFSSDFYIMYRKHERVAALRALEKYLLPTILSLERLRSVSWSLLAFTPTIQTQAIVSGLSSLKYLTSFFLRIDNFSPYIVGEPPTPFFLDLKPLYSLEKITVVASYTLYDFLREPLRTLIVQSPQLRSLSFQCDRHWVDWNPSKRLLSNILEGLAPCSLHTLELKEEMSLGIASVCMPHLHSLTALHIVSCRYPEGFSQLWSMFISAHVFLKDLKTSFLDHHSLDYMCSYTGLEKLAVIFDKIDDVEAPNEAFCSRFFAQVLPMHAETLIELSVGTEAHYYPGEWTFNDSNAPFISQCTKLQHLSFRISTRPYENTTLLLDMAAALPRLTYLHIKSSSGVYTSYIQPWDMAILHYGPVLQSTFNPSLVVRCDNQFFRMCTDDRGLRFVLCNPPEPSIFKPLPLDQQHWIFPVSRWSRVRNWCSKSWARLHHRSRRS